MLVKLLRCLKLMHTQAFIRHIQNTCQEKGVIFHLHQCFFQKYGQKGVGGGEQMRKSNIYHIYIGCDKSQIILFYLTLSSDDGD